MNSQLEQDKFLNELKEFLFFHLGSDAKIKLSFTAGSLNGEVEHQRIRPMEIYFTMEEIFSLARDRTRFENRMLSLLTRYRHS